MKLIREEINDVNFLREEKEDGKKDYFIEGVFMQSNVKNKNGRIYPKNVIEREVQRYNKEFVSKREEILSMIWDMEEEIMGKEV